MVCGSGNDHDEKESYINDAGDIKNKTIRTEEIDFF